MLSRRGFLRRMAFAATAGMLGLRLEQATEPEPWVTYTAPAQKVVYTGGCGGGKTNVFQAEMQRQMREMAVLWRQREEAMIHGVTEP